MSDVPRRRNAYSQNSANEHASGFICVRMHRGKAQTELSTETRSITIRRRWGRCSSHHRQHHRSWCSSWRRQPHHRQRCRQDRSHHHQHQLRRPHQREVWCSGLWCGRTPGSSGTGPWNLEQYQHVEFEVRRNETYSHEAWGTRGWYDRSRRSCGIGPWTCLSACRTPWPCDPPHHSCGNHESHQR